MTRRMFSDQIICSDAFQSLSAKAQMLYIHINMEADDEGFTNKALTIARAHGCTTKELKQLYQLRFLLDLGDGVTVVKHWRLNNLMRQDRMRLTVFSEKRDMLALKDNGVYTEKKKPDDVKMTTKWRQNDNQMTSNCQPNDNQMTSNCQPNDNQMTSQDNLRHNNIIYRESKNIYNYIDKNISNTNKLTRAQNKPSVEEVQQYLKEIGANFTAEHFIDYYNANGWKVGKSMMKDWKAAARNWKRREVEKKMPDFTIEEETGGQDLEEVRNRLFSSENQKPA